MYSYLNSIGCKYDKDRILHIIPLKEEEWICVYSEIESDPLEHPIEHLIYKNGYSMSGACVYFREKILENKERLYYFDLANKLGEFVSKVGRLSDSIALDAGKGDLRLQVDLGDFD